MIIAEVDRLEREVGSKYALVIVAAKRARHLKEGMQPLVGSSSANPLTVAFEEIAQSKVRPAGPEEESVAAPSGKTAKAARKTAGGTE